MLPWILRYTRLPFSQPSLLPRFAVHANEEAVRLLAQSVEGASRRRKFASPVDFHRVLRQELTSAILHQKFDHVRLLFDYQVFLGDIRAERGWTAADDYHWRLMTKCADGQFDMTMQGCYDPWSYNEMSEKFPRAAKPKNRQPRAPGQKGKKECSYH